jgi:hypothetical protein
MDCASVLFLSHLSAKTNVVRPFPIALHNSIPVRPPRRCSGPTTPAARPNVDALQLEAQRHVFVLHALVERDLGGDGRCAVAVAAARVHGAVAVAVGVVSLAQDVRFGVVVVVRLRRAVALLQPVSSRAIVVGVVVGKDQGVGEAVV